MESGDVTCNWHDCEPPGNQTVVVASSSSSPESDHWLIHTRNLGPVPQCEQPTSTNQPIRKHHNITTAWLNMVVTWCGSPVGVLLLLFVSAPLQHRCHESTLSSYFTLSWLSLLMISVIRRERNLWITGSAPNDIRRRAAADCVSSFHLHFSLSNVNVWKEKKLALIVFLKWKEKWKLSACFTDSSPLIVL